MPNILAGGFSTGVGVLLFDNTGDDRWRSGDWLLLLMTADDLGIDSSGFSAGCSVTGAVAMWRMSTVLV